MVKKRDKVDWSIAEMHLTMGALVTEAQAVRISGESRKWVRDKVERGRILSCVVDGQRLVKLTSLIMMIAEDCSYDELVAIEDWLYQKTSAAFGERKMLRMLSERWGTKRAHRQKPDSGHSHGHE
jgi:hypothetical protein